MWIGRNVLVEHFDRVGYHVETAHDGNEGITRTLQMRPDVIVLDLRMPRLDGWDMVKVLRTYATTASIPVIAWTGVQAPGQALVLAVGCNAVVRKPCAPEKVEEAIDPLLEKDDQSTDRGALLSRAPSAIVGIDPMARRLISTLSTLACVVLGWMVYDNVWSPVEPIQSKAEAAACTVKDCAKRHGMTKMDRMPYGQSFEYTWEDGPVEVSCHRASYVFGLVECRHEP